MGVKSSACGEILPDLRHAQTTSPATLIAIREAADRLKRRWIGIDIAFHAIKRVTQVRLRERYNLLEGRDFEIEGVPLTLEGAQYLWKHDKYHFQQWSIEQVDGFVTSKRTADGGIDGRLYFDVPDEGEGRRQRKHRRCARSARCL